MMRLRNTRKILQVATLGLCVAVGAGSAVAQNIDSDVVEVQAQVVGAMSVTAINSPINLGQLFAGSTGNIAADGTSTPFSTAAQFTVNGPNGLNWQLSVAYANLTGPGAEVITIAAPTSGDQICFNDTVGNQAPCSVVGTSPLTIPKASHNGDGTAWVGFSFSVPNPATPGAYSNPNAIQLTAEGLIGT